MMFLYDNDLVSLDKKIYHYLPELKRTNKKSMVLQDILLHQAGLTPYIPFWKKTVDEFGVQPPYYSIYHEKEFDFQIASDLYANKHLRDSLWQWTIESDLLSKPRWQKKYDYRYSDVGYYIMQKLAERILNDPINNFLEQNFYQPLGLNTMTYLPLCDFPEERIAPTEDDALFRKDLITGLVHDQGAAMYGGIAGHAGLFSNAQDLAILMQMNLWDGNYGGVRYFSKGTVPFFAQKHYEENRRGLGWDKPVMEDGPSPTSHYSSGLTFGHTGFTGTAAWADPEFGLVFIFLSNRIHPDANNRKLITNDIRTRIMDVIYESIFSFEEKSLEYIN
jgi:beta-N-acetylhexosaminidase